VKFKSDGAGWRDLKFANGGEEMQVSIPDRTAEAGKHALPFIACEDYSGNTSIGLTRRQLRTFATKILKELNK
jgi:hypothetical protein